MPRVHGRGLGVALVAPGGGSGGVVIDDDSAAVAVAGKWMGRFVDGTVQGWRSTDTSLRTGSWKPLGVLFASTVAYGEDPVIWKDRRDGRSA